MLRTFLVAVAWLCFFACVVVFFNSAGVFHEIESLILFVTWLLILSLADISFRLDSLKTQKRQQRPSGPEWPQPDSLEFVADDRRRSAEAEFEALADAAARQVRGSPPAN